MNNFSNLKNVILSMILMVVVNASLMASSHREAPLISNDPLADNVDLYAFRSPDNPDMITIIATYVPLQLPHGGPNYYSFGENIRYEIHVDNDASIAGDEVTYRFTFMKENEDPTTFFNIRLGAQNLKTTYNLERSLDGGDTWQMIVQNGVVPPNNIGPRSIESAVGLNTTYNALFQGAITQASTGETIFAGPTDDPFFVDLGGIFDLGDAPRQNRKAVDGLACYNVSAIAIQVPISTLLKEGAPSTPTNILDGDYVIGVWASASRPAITTLSADNDPEYMGEWIQVSRLGMPLTNEAVIAIGDKDYWNSITPYEEIAETTLDEYFYNPELALYMDDDQFGTAVPAFAPLRIQTASLGAFDFTNGADGLFGLKGSAAVAGTALDDNVFGTLLLPDAAKPRSVDLWPIFHTGVPNARPYQLATGKMGDPLAAGKPFINNFLPNGGDMLRLNMAVPVTPRDDANFSSLGLIQAAAIGLTVAPFNTTADLEFIPNMDGFPNGRRLEDDVTRIELQAVGGAVLAAIGLWYDDYDPQTSPSPVTEDLLNVLTYTTGVEKNDREFTGSFPYLAQPFSGTGNCSGEVQPNASGAVAVNRLFVSSNTSGTVGVYDVLDDGTLQFSSFPSQDADADGIYYDQSDDVLYQLNRIDNVINAYSNVASSVDAGMTPDLTATSTSDFINGREIAVIGSKLVVAQDANAANGNQNRLIVYNVSATSITLDKIYDVEINLWGIHLDGGNLWAVEDNSNRVVSFNNFFQQAAGLITPSTVVEVEGLVRTHGLTYIADSDLMLLTDVGAASSPDDGAIVSVENFSAASADGVISLGEQTRVEGPSTFLGNPVDIALDAETMVIFVAERANGGGRVLGFAVDGLVNGDVAPDYNETFAGASAINIFDENQANSAMTLNRLFLSSNTSGMVGAYDVLDTETLRLTTFPSQADDADGIYYDEPADVLYQLNRIDNVINAYSNVASSVDAGMAPTLTATSTSDFINGREIAVIGSKLVVAQDANAANGDQNRLIVYNASATSITLDKIYDVEINLWGIHLDGGNLWAVEDNSNRVVSFNNFFQQPAGLITPSTVVEVEGLVRTHGLTYISADDLMLLTDVGAASSPEDGAIISILDFSIASSDGVISLGEQTRVEGPSTFLGNPVDIALDAETMVIFVAERANGGGRLLGFAVDGLVNGDLAPKYNETFAGASAINIFDENQADVCTLVDGGAVTFTGGGTETTIVIDGNPDVLSFESNIDPVSGGYSFTYVVTDANGLILGIPPGNEVDFDPAGAGTCYVYGLGYTGTLNIEVGDDFLAAGLMISDDCFDVSGNRLTVNRNAPAVGADVSLSIMANNLLYAQYEQVTYTITVTNDGPEATDNVSVAAGLPNGMVYSGDNTSKGNYELFFERWDVGTLASGETATLELSLFTLVKDVDLVNFVQVLSSDTDDPDSTPGNDTNQTADEDDEASVTVTPIANGGPGGGSGSADLELSISTDASSYNQYTFVTYTLNLVNNGPDATSDIIVDVPKPNGLAYTSDNSTIGVYNLFFEEWTIANLAVGETAQLTLVLFTLTDNGSIDLFTEVRTSFQPDPDSTPGNDVGQTPDEDDEALATIQNMSLTATPPSSARSVSGSFNGDVKLYPNPVTADLTIEFIAEETPSADNFFIYDVTGRSMLTQRFDAVAGFNQISFDASDLPAGLYFLYIPNENGEAVMSKFVKE